MIQSPILSIIIVNYNVKEYILNCIQSIQDKIDAKRCPYEVIVSDNGSVDSSIEAIHERFPWVKVIENNANLGFSKANNVAVKQAKGEVLFIFNPDTLVIKGMEEMVEHIREHKEIGIMGPVIYDQDNNMDLYTCFLEYSPLHLFLGTFFDPYYNRRRNHNLMTRMKSFSPVEVDKISGACMLIRKELFDKVGGFDETFFFGGEEQDICLTVKENGYAIKLFPLAEIVHFRSKSIPKNPSMILEKRIHNHTNEPYFYLYKKHFPSYAIVFLYFLTLIVNVRLIVVSSIKKVYFTYKKDTAAYSQRDALFRGSRIILKYSLSIKTIKFLFSSINHQNPAQK
ncbi:MAG: glycosyltransferase family 2 protein [Deltaproteobacteria bacterium]|nr:glycosyltransferase family 2 protein [Deltaproteobacteria bacterium]MCL5791436.1 glycosyltransferase family 2 protein [Deltaproteobacteria bacterium]